MLVLLKNHLYHLKDNIFECFFKKYNRLLFKNNNCFPQHIMMENPRPKKEK